MRIRYWISDVCSSDLREVANASASHYGAGQGPSEEGGGAVAPPLPLSLHCVADDVFGSRIGRPARNAAAEAAGGEGQVVRGRRDLPGGESGSHVQLRVDRKSTRLNSSH